MLNGSPTRMFLYIIIIMYVTRTHNDVSCLGDALEIFLCFLSSGLALIGNAVGVISEGELAICLPHFVVGCCAWDAEGAIGFLERDVDVWLPRLLPVLLVLLLMLLLIVEGIVVCSPAICEVDGWPAEHGVEKPSEEKAEE